MSSDTFYARDEDAWKLWAGYGVLAMEMETSALSILTVTDNLATGDHTGPAEREHACQNAARIALALA